MLRLFGLKSIYLRWVINICLIYFIARYTRWGSFATILLRSTRNTSFCHVIFIIITKIYLYQKFKINPFVIFSNTNFCCIQVNGRRSWLNTFNWRRPKSCRNQAQPLLDFLRRTRAAGWIGFDGYKDTWRKLKIWFIDKGKWIVVREALLHLNSTGFRYS